MTVRHGGLEIDWLGYATVRIAAPGGPVVYLDPGRYGVLTGEWTPPAEGVGHPEPTDYRPADGDLVCVSHLHHYDSDGIDRVAREDATVLVHEAVDTAGLDRTDGSGTAPVEALPYDVRRVSDDEALSVAVDRAGGGDGGIGDVHVRTTPMYNEGPTPSHPEGEGCGFRVAVDGTAAFWPGDSDALDAHRDVDADLFLANVCGGSVAMDRAAAADLAEAIDPDLVCPVHYDTLEFLRADSRAFAGDVAARGVPVVLDER